MDDMWRRNPFRFVKCMDYCRAPEDAHLTPLVNPFCQERLPQQIGFRLGSCFETDFVALSP
jgi:hypothetical protein